MDTIPRIQLGDPAGLHRVDAPAMRFCSSALVLHSVTVRHLPANVNALECVLTIAVRGSSHTTGRVVATRERNGESLAEDAVLATPPARTVSSAVVVSSFTGGGRGDDHHHRRDSAPVTNASTFKIHVSGLNLVFPGVRRRARDFEAVTATAPPIDNPREFSAGVSVTVHSLDRDVVLGTALCVTSGEAALLSYPRGEVALNFRVYPCFDGQIVTQPLFGKECIGSRFLLTAADTEGVAAAAAITAGPDAAEGVAVVADGSVAADGGEGCAGDSTANTSTATNGNGNGSDNASGGGAIEVYSADPAAGSDNNDDDDDGGAAAAAIRTVVSRPPPTEEQKRLTAALEGLVPCFTEDQRRAAFALYSEGEEDKGSNNHDPATTAATATITRAQLLHFVRSHVAFADCCDDDEALLRLALVPYLRSEGDLAEPPVQACGAAATTGNTNASSDRDDDDDRQLVPATPASSPVTAECAAADIYAVLAAEQHRKDRGALVVATVAAAAPAALARVNVDHFYYTPPVRTATATANDDGEREGEEVGVGMADEACAVPPPLAVNYELFSIIALRLARA